MQLSWLTAITNTMSRQKAGNGPRLAATHRRQTRPGRPADLSKSSTLIAGKQQESRWTISNRNHKKAAFEFPTEFEKQRPERV